MTDIVSTPVPNVNVARFLEGETIAVESQKGLGLDGVDRFEHGLIAARLALTYSYASVHTWNKRVPTSRELKPEDFNGNFLSVQVSPLDDEVAKYLSLFKRLAAGSSLAGYRVTADMESTGRGIVDRLDRRVWIVKRPENSDAARHQSPYTRHFDNNVPALYNAVNQAATIVRTMLDKQAIAHPMSSGFESSLSRKGRH